MTVRELKEILKTRNDSDRILFLDDEEISAEDLTFVPGNFEEEEDLFRLSKAGINGAKAGQTLKDKISFEFEPNQPPGLNIELFK